MPKLTIGVAVLLVLLGVGGWILGGQSSLTALIPAFFGLPLAATGLAARRERWRRHAMHGAAVIALLGAGGSLVRAVPTVLRGEPLGLAAFSQLAMGTLLIIFLVLCIRSFMQARTTAKQP